MIGLMGKSAPPRRLGDLLWGAPAEDNLPRGSLANYVSEWCVLGCLSSVWTTPCIEICSLMLVDVFVQAFCRH